jgi:type IV pilus assembly protein PilY1
MATVNLNLKVPGKGLTFTVDFTAATGTNDVQNFTVNSVSIFDTGTALAESTVEELATAFANAVNGFESTPNYKAQVDSVDASLVKVYLEQSAGAALVGTTPLLSGTSSATITNLICEDIATVDNREVSRVYDNGSDVVVEVPTNGASPLYLESLDTLATTVALFSNFVTVPTVDGDMYLAKERFDILDSNFDDTVGLSFTVTVSAATGTNDITDFTVNSVSIFDTATPLANASTSGLATDLAAAINSYVSVPEYTASASGSVVTVFLDPAAGDSLAGTLPVESGTATTVITKLGGSKFVYNLNEEGDTFEALSTNDIDTFVAALGNIVTISTADGNIYINKDRIAAITEIDASSCRIIYKSLFGFYDKIFEANESRSAVKTKIDAL